MERRDSSPICLGTKENIFSNREQNGGNQMTTMCIMAANYLIERTNEYNTKVDFFNQISMSCKRLQKLLYFGDVIFMQLNNGKSMFKDEFYAWPSGPVIPSVYDEFMQYQNGKMMPVLGEHTPLTKSMIQALDTIFERTTDIDTEDLVIESHVENGPWNQVYDPNDSGHFQIVTKESTYEFYRSRDIFNS